MYAGLHWWLAGLWLVAWGASDVFHRLEGASAEHSSAGASAPLGADAEPREGDPLGHDPDRCAFCLFALTPADNAMPDVAPAVRPICVGLVLVPSAGTEMAPPDFALPPARAPPLDCFI